jgi:glucosamine-6-phosphate deaminase
MDFLREKGMAARGNLIRKFRRGTLRVEVYKDGIAAGEAAAQAAALALRSLAGNSGKVPVIFATGSSQANFLQALTALADLPWTRMQAFHMDEYVGIGPDHPASFCRYLRERLLQKVPIGEFFFIDGETLDPDQTCNDYAATLKSANPQLCLCGIGENGHLAFNDPHVADFNDPLDMKVVRLDTPCGQQQVAERWFERIEQVPELAMTLTIPALMRVPKLIATVPGPRKAAIVRRALEGSISTDCPATILRTHPDAAMYLDLESAAELDGGV